MVFIFISVLMKVTSETCLKHFFSQKKFAEKEELISVWRSKTLECVV